jgi:hypothetical protein
MRRACAPISVAGLLTSHARAHDMATWHDDARHRGGIIDRISRILLVIISADVLNPRFDYCPPELIDLSITNFGAHSPSYVYRMLAEYYNPEDHDLLTHPASPTLGGGAPVGGGKFAMGGLARLSSDH